MSVMPDWGPSHQTSERRSSWKWAVRVLLVLGIVGALDRGTRGQSTVGVIFGIAWLVVFAVAALPQRAQRRGFAWLRHRRPRRRRRPATDPLAAVRQAALSSGGVYLGADERGGARYARPQRAVLVLGPPRSGKTSGVIIPALIAHTGPAVSTSTKIDVARATRPARERGGRTWLFDPTGTGGGVGTSEQLRWSPVQSSVSWDGALLMARAMTTSSGIGTTDRSHWANRAQALLAPLLHAAAVHDRDMQAVVEWVMRHDINDAGVLLEDERCSPMAFHSLLGIHHTEDRERSSIFSATADALQAYTGEHALTAATDPNFDADAFVRSQDTVYIHAPADAQAAVAPVVCGLLSEIRRATYRAHNRGQLTHGRVLFALDEVANIAPLEELPQIASEGGGQGLTLLAALQDLSQARHRWGAQADGFLTLFGAKLLLPGIADPKTLEAVSTMLGEYDRQMISRSVPQVGLLDGHFNATRNHARPHRTVTHSTQRTRVLSPGEIANIPAGHALHLDATRWELLTLTPAHRSEPWRTLTTPTSFTSPTAR